MNTIKYISISVTTLLALIILLVIIYLFLKPFKVIKDEEENIKKSYGIWFSALFIGGTVVIYFLINAAFEAIDVILRMNQQVAYMQVSKALASLFLIGFGWYTAWCLIINRILGWLYKKSDTQSMDGDDVAFFLMKSMLFLGLIIGLSPVLELLLKLSIPQIEIPFYH